MPAKRKVTMEMLKRVPDLLEEGKRYDEIAKELGISRTTLTYWIKRMKWAGVKMNITRGPKPLKLDERETS